MFKHKNKLFVLIIVFLITSVFITTSHKIPEGQDFPKPKEKISDLTFSAESRQPNDLSLIEIGKFDDDGGLSLGVAINDDVVFVANENQGLEVINFSEPSKPEKIISFKISGLAQDVFYFMGFVYVGHIGGVSIYDAQDLTNIKFAKKITQEGTVVDLMVSDHVLVYVTQNDGMHLFDVNNPYQPIKFPSSWYSVFTMTGVALLGKVISIAENDGGVEFIDLTFISNPMLASRWNETGMYGLGVDAAVINGKNYCFLACGNDGLKILDISNPRFPTSVANVTGIGAIQDVKAKNNIVYCSAYDSGMVIVSCADPSNPQITDSYDANGLCLDADSKEGRTVIANQFAGVTLLNTDNLNDIQYLGSFLDHGNADHLVVKEDLVYLADKSGGLEIINISNPMTPQRISQFMGSSNIEAVEIENDIAFLSCFSDGLYLVDISDPTNPTAISHYDTGIHYVKNIFLENWKMFVATTNLETENCKILVLNYSNPANITKISEYEFPNPLILPNDVLVKDEFLFVGTITNGIHVLNISDLSNIHFIDNYFNGGEASSLLLEEDILFVADGTDGCEIYDIADPTNIQLLDSVNTNGYSYDLALYQDYALVADKQGGVVIINISTITDTIKVGQYVYPTVLGIGVYDQYVVAGAQTDGLLVLAFDSDGDSLTDSDEVTIWGTDPFDWDTDDDEMPDGFEVNNNLNPLDASDVNNDPDNDGLNNGQEYLEGTDPHNPDTDGDLMPDGYEVEVGYDPTIVNDDDLDDEDGLLPYQEYLLGTDPFDPDTDDDTFLDGLEYFFGTDPLDPNDNPNRRAIRRIIIIGSILLVISILIILQFVNMILKRIEKNKEREQMLKEHAEKETLMF
jgi:hypothetical protein